MWKPDLKKYDKDIAALLDTNVATKKTVPTSPSAALATMVSWFKKTFKKDPPKQ
jgi:hypothetical protein